MKFGENLKLIRKKVGMSQEELAEKMEVSRQSISKWEVGEGYPEMTNLLYLCKVLNCQISELVNDRIKDIDCMDEEVQERVVKFQKNKQIKVKRLGFLIHYITIFLKVICILAISILTFVMIFVPITLNKINFSDKNTIIETTTDRILISNEKSDFHFEFNGKDNRFLNKWSLNNKSKFEGLIKKVQKQPKKVIIIIIEGVSLYLFINIFIIIKILNYISLFFS